MRNKNQIIKTISQTALHAPTQKSTPQYHLIDFPLNRISCKIFPDITNKYFLPLKVNITLYS